MTSLPDRYRTCIYRSIQEALTNCVRHARPHTINVNVTGHGDYLDVAVHDDGVGFDAARRRNGLGLRGIEERVKELDGTMTITGYRARDDANDPFASKRNDGGAPCACCWLMITESCGGG